MGEIADGLINGDFDFHTGEYIGKGFGYPRTLDRSLSWENPISTYKRNYKHSKAAAFKGVKHYLKKGFKITDITATVNEYMPTQEYSLKQKCLKIQNDWGAFVTWFKEKQKK